MSTVKCPSSTDGPWGGGGASHTTLFCNWKGALRCKYDLGLFAITVNHDPPLPEHEDIYGGFSSDVLLLMWAQYIAVEALLRHERKRA